MSDVIAEGTNLPAWSEAETRGTAAVANEQVKVPTAAAQEILDDPEWATKIRRALADSEAGRVRSLEDHRKSL